MTQEFWLQAASLMASSFISATLFPGGSEALLMWLVQRSHQPWGLVFAASVANTLGGMVNYALGRWLPAREITPLRYQRALGYVQRYGVWCLIFSWLPLIGDLLCVAAGWLRCRMWITVLLMFSGKTVRYVMIAWWGLSE